tara:strand:- start:17 stop:307 length:291 start_codon:yes stop_codon:yes gene_type:complete
MNSVMESNEKYVTQEVLLKVSKFIFNDISDNKEKIKENSDRLNVIELRFDVLRKQLDRIEERLNKSTSKGGKKKQTKKLKGRITRKDKTMKRKIIV